MEAEDQVTPERVRYAYIPDPKDPRRVVTLAWYFVGTCHVRYAVAINRVEKTKEFANRPVVEHHRKSSARRTAYGRLERKERTGTTRILNVGMIGTDSSSIIRGIQRSLAKMPFSVLTPAQQTASSVLKRARRESEKRQRLLRNTEVQEFTAVANAN